MSTAEEVDAAILRILLDSEHGRQWLEEAAEMRKMEACAEGLLRAGVDRGFVRDLWSTGDSEVVQRVTALNDEQVNALVREWREREGER